MAIDLSNRFEILKLEMQLLQQRLTKYDELIWAVRGWAVTLTVALTSWASTKLGEPAAVAWVLRIAAVVPALFWIEEGMLRTGYVTKYIDRYRLLRSALNDSSADLQTLPLYDLTSHYAGLTPHLPRLVRSFLRFESIFLYSVLTTLPLLAMLFLQTDNTARGKARKAQCVKAEQSWSPRDLAKNSEPTGGPANLPPHCSILSSAGETLRYS